MAKKIITVTVNTKKIDPIELKSDLLAVGVFSDGSANKLCKELDQKLNGAITKVKELGDFKAKAGSTTMLYTDGKIAAQRLLLLGLGERKKADIDTVRKAAMTAANKAVAIKAKTAVLALHQGFGKKPSAECLAATIACASHYGAYAYDEFITDTENGRNESLDVVIAESDPAKLKDLNKGAKIGSIIGTAQSFARTIANRPGNVLNPSVLAAEAKKIASKTDNLTCTVFDEKELTAKKMGGILAIGSGSVNKPRMIILKYTPKKKLPAKAETIALVGKAITFDSGGISIKPSAGMQEMKMDMSGGAAVLAAMKAIAELKLPAKVYGIIPSAENMPGGASCRPGDIVTTYSGKTVEIQNTDAEGRMILCDAISYAVKQNCDTIVDIATLTGACKVALGNYKAGLMGNNDKLIKKLQNASKETGEAVWHLPSGEEYLSEMKNKISDLKNIGSRWGGASTAAAFLGQFAEKTKWAHIDMAPVDIFSGDSKSPTAGSTGFGVRLLTKFVIDSAK